MKDQALSIKQVIELQKLGFNVETIIKDNNIINK